MKFVTFKRDGQELVGVVNQKNQVIAVKDLGLNYQSMVELIEHLSEAEKSQLSERMDSQEGIDWDKAEILAPIPFPRDIIAVSQNYATHVKETCLTNNMPYKNPEHCSYFFRRVNRAIGPDGGIYLHSAITDKLDYEVELGFVIGKECRNVLQKDAFDYVFGYTVSNDFTARDIQNNLPQYSYAKGLDDTTPLGPWIVTADEIADPQKLDISLRVNGETRQKGNTDDMIFSIAYVIQDLSKGMTLYPGDVIITGTPSGIGAAMKPPQYLKVGDVIESEVEGVGILRNIVVE